MDRDSSGESREAAGLVSLGQRGLRHWQQSVITQPGLDDRGSVFFAAIEMTRMPMLLTDPNLEDNPIVFANNAFYDLTGYDERDVLGRNCRFLQGALTDREIVAQMREAVDKREAISVELFNYRRDGSAFWNAVFIGPVFDREGKLLYFFASQLDVSRRRESEQAFRQAQKMESIGQLTAGLAHDFNNLLHVITGSLDRIRSRRTDEQAVERYIAAASMAAERGAKLTRQLLAYARRSRLEPKRIEVTTVIGSFGELLDTSVGKKAQLQMNLRRRLPEIMVDPVHLEMALLNVVINARDASTEGAAITISTRLSHVEAEEPYKKPGDYVVLAVTDQGIGMPPHVKARATEPFFTTKGPGEGTGLGLAMVHGFVQQTGGYLDIETAPGEGTTISLYFPVAGEAPEAPVLESSRFKPTRVDPASAPLVLVVDDNEEITAMAQDTLLEAGYRVKVAHSAEQGMRVVDESDAGGMPVSLVFSDVVMPGGMNGLMFAEELKSRHPSLPVLLTTGYNDELAFEGTHPGSMDVIGKPYRQSEMLNRVQAALRRGARHTSDHETSDFGHALG